MEPGQFTLISMGLVRYSCGHILGHHEPQQIWAVDVFHHAPRTHGIQNAEMQKKFFVMSLPLYSILPAFHEVINVSSYNA